MSDAAGLGRPGVEGLSLLAGPRLKNAETSQCVDSGYKANSL